MHYDSRTIALHWATAILVLTLWVMGQTAGLFPHGPLRSGYQALHVSLGFVFVAVLLARILWRGSGGTRLPAADSGVLQIVSKMTHYLLYALLLVVAGLGVINAFVRGYSLFGIVHLPQIGNREWREPITELHELAANGLLAVALVHASAALAHHYIWHDRVLERMLPQQVLRESK